MANPFEDADVQAAASGGGGGGDAYGDNTTAASQPSNEYGGGAYDNPAPPTLSQAQQEMAVTVGGAVAQQAATAAVNDVQDDYNKQSAQQTDAHSAPETPNFCVKLMMWLPIRYFAFLGGIGLVVAPILDWLFFVTSFVYAVLGVYLLIFGVMTIIVESPIFKLTRKPQLSIFYWFRLLSRMWGRAWFYFFVAILTFSEITNDFSVGFLVGIYLLVIAILMLIISRQAGTKYRRIFEFIAGGADPENQDELSGKLTRKFDELDLDGDQKIGSLEIVKLAEQAGRGLSNAERHAIQTFLDAGCNGSVDRNDFVNQFMNFNLKQKWL